MQNDPAETVRRLAALAGVPLPEERVAALAAALPLVRGGAGALAAIDYGETGPAETFRPRPEARR